MTDVFISYSRKDALFVKQLHALLAERARDVWIDWEDIPATADWWAEICSGIEKSDTFLFVVSSHSLQSAICHFELAHAAQHNKRIIPVIRDQPDVKTVFTALVNKPLDTNQRRILGKRELKRVISGNWAVLSRHNWLFFNHDEEFVPVFEKLLAAIDTDLAYVREHTNLLVRLLQWEKRNRQTGYLLTGDEVSEAEKWLKSAAGKEPQPTVEHLEFINASRAEETRRNRLLRRLRIASIIAMIVGLASIAAMALAFTGAAQSVQIADAANARALDAATREALAIAAQRTADADRMTAVHDQSNALNARSTADAARLIAIEDRAAAQAAEAEARKLVDAVDLAADALGQLPKPGGSYETAALLASYSLRQSYNPLAEWVLLQALDDLRAVQVFTGYTRSVYSVALSPDGQYIVSAGEGGELILWSVETGEALRRLEGHLDFIKAVAFNPQGTMIISGGGDTTVRLWDVASGAVLRVFEGHTEPITSVAWSPDGSKALSGSWDNTMRLWDVNTGSLLHVFEGHSKEVNAVAFNPNGTRALSASADATVRTWDIERRELRYVFEGHTGSVIDADFSPDGQWVISGAADDIKLWDENIGREIDTHAPATPAQRVEFSPDGRYVLSANNTVFRLWDSETLGSWEMPEGYTGTAVSIAFNGDGIWGFSQQPLDKKYILRMLDISLQSGRVVEPLDSEGVLRMAVSADGKKVIAAHLTAMSQLTLWDFVGTEHPYLDSLPVPFEPEIRIIQPGAVAFNADATRALLADQMGPRLLLWDLTTGEVIRDFYVGGPGFSGVAFTEDETQVITADTGGIIAFWDIASGDFVSSFVASDTALSSMAITADHSRALVSDFEGGIYLWNIQTRELIAAYDGHADEVTSVAISPDESMFVSASMDGSLYVWDITTGEIIHRLEGHKGAIFSVAFSPDGTMIAAGGSDMNVRLWDVASAKTVRALVGHTREVWTVAFHPNGKQLISGSTDYTLRVWDIDYLDTIDYACTRISNPLSDEQRELFGIQASSPCPSSTETASR